MDPSAIDQISQRITQLWVSRRQQQPQMRRSETSMALSDQQGMAQMRQRLLSAHQHVVRYEDWELQDKARSIMPVERFHEEAKTKMQATSHEQAQEALAFEDHVIKSLLQWFKHEFFKWVNEAPCDRCQGATTGVGMGEPTAEELRYGAHRVELYRCNGCALVTRFPRYNDPGKLLETRRGRCGEWANCFTLCCRSLGVQVRYALDFTDHVWTEYYSDALQRWIHLDSCEAAFDTPLVYEAGWGKKLNYIFGISITEVIDLVQRYSVKWDEVFLRRTILSEPALIRLLISINQQLRARLNSQERLAMEKMLEKEQKELILAFLRRPENSELLGRQSGSVDWRKNRGELGNKDATP